MPEVPKRNSLLIVAVLVMSILWPGVASASPSLVSDLYCLGEKPTIVFIGYDSAIVGTDGDDVIFVDGGWNNVYAGDGDDKICVVGHFNGIYADNGDDDLIASGLHNTLSGGDDDDRLTVDDLSNTMDGGSGADRCNGDSC